MDGFKTKISAIMAVLTAISSILVSVVGILQGFWNVEALHNVAALLAWAKSITGSKEWLTIAGSLGTIGIGHKIEKLNANAQI